MNRRNRVEVARFMRLLLILCLLQSSVCFGESLLPQLLEGAHQDLPRDIPLPDLLARGWAETDHVYVKKGLEGQGRYVTSCVEMDIAFENDEFAMDSASMGREALQREYCQNIKRLMRATAASHSDIVFPFCLDRDLYLKLSEALEGLWGASGLESLDVTACKRSVTKAIVKYQGIIEPENEWHKGLSSGHIGIRYLVQGDFDGDGWLDVIAAVSAGPEFPAGVWYQSGMGAVVKISRVDGELKVARFNDL
jgi:hypothetical protein